MKTTRSAEEGPKAPRHTPGPWYVVTFDDEPYPVIVGPHGDERITVVSGNQGTDESDARLIAAAPELLEELKNAVTLLNAVGYVDGDIVDAARAAIAKAEGRTP